ncbi:MAG: cytochrome P450 [Xanthobacteraceae bacterium]|jgi:cytochrome P450
MANPQRDYLKEYDVAPDDQKYPLVRRWMETEPLPFFKQLREQRPILVTPECALVSLYNDVTDVLQMPKVFTVDLYKPKMGVTPGQDGYLMAYDDDALHYREKSLMQGFLNRDDLPRVRKLVGQTAQKILDEARGAIEVVNAYCRMVPAQVVQDYFGLDGVKCNDLIEWSFWNQYDVFHNQPFDLNSPEQFQYIIKKHGEVTEQLSCYIGVLIARKLVTVKIGNVIRWIVSPLRLVGSLVCRLFGYQPGGGASKDDMVKRMLRSTFAKEVDFGLARVAINAGGLLIGSIETTAQAVAQVIEFFLETRPDLLGEVKRKAVLGDPGAFDAMVWEALRFVPIGPYLFRQASIDYAIATGTNRETTIRARTNVLLLSQSAMFDPYAYAEPDMFNPDRNWYHNFNFGFGSHDCLGKYVGMVMIPEMVRQVMLRNGIGSEGAISRKNGALYGQGPGGGTDGPFPEEFHLAWQ